MTTTTRRPEREWWLLTLATYSRRLAAAVLRVLRRLTGGIIDGLANVPPFALADEVMRLIPVGAWTAELRRAVRSTITAAVGVGAADELHRWPGPVGLLGRARARVSAVATSLVNGTGWELAVTNIRNAAIKAARLASPVAALANLTRLFSRPALANRATRIGETEAHTAIQSGKHAARVELLAAGVINGKKWNAVRDDRTREAHEHADGQVVAVDEYFRVGGEFALFPGDPRLSVANRIWCRCWTTAVKL